METKTQDDKDYKAMRNKYIPAKWGCELKTIFILESPPVSGKYFYDTNGKVTEPLFSAMMKYVLRFNKCEFKSKGLEQFAKSGYLIVDATYKQINKLKAGERDKEIRQHFAKLKQDLERLIGTKLRGDVKLILIKVNIYKILNLRLREAGFNVCNMSKIPFPSHGWQQKFGKALKQLL